MTDNNVFSAIINTSLTPSHYHGVVIEFDKLRGCGTIEMETGEYAFVRYSAIIGEGLRTLLVGEHVSFDVEKSHRGFNALRVTRC